MDVQGLPDNAPQERRPPVLRIRSMAKMFTGVRRACKTVRSQAGAGRSPGTSVFEVAIAEKFLKKAISKLALRARDLADKQSERECG